MNEIRSGELPLPKKVNTELRLNGREGLMGLKAHAILEVLFFVLRGSGNECNYKGLKHTFHLFQAI